jgi:hypothetical protein
MSERIYHCAVTDFSALLGNGKRGWPEQPVLYTTDGPCGNVSAPDFRDFSEIVLDDIRNCCAIKLLYTSNIKTANVVMRGRAIDGRGKVLARSHLPIGLTRNSDMVVYQEYDSELWSSQRKAPEGKMSLWGTLLHEWGHGGAAIEHAPDHIVALMRAFMDPDVNELREWDIAQWVALYGPNRGVAPVPVPTPSDGDTVEVRYQNGKAVVKVNGVLYRPSPFAGSRS